MTRLAVFVATAGGAGYAPVAPGTAGSAVGLLIFFLVRGWPFAWIALLIVAVTVVGTWASGRAAVVIDEVAGQLVTLAGTGVGGLGAIVGFFLFRILDIIKPWPAGRFESLPGGFGIMADDLMAGVYGNVVLLILLRLFPGML
jgi:phosphatidylglycerophosphatase A